MTTYGKNLFVTDAVTDTSLIKKYEKIEISSLASVPTDTQNATVTVNASQGSNFIIKIGQPSNSAWTSRNLTFNFQGLQANQYQPIITFNDALVSGAVDGSYSMHWVASASRMHITYKTTASGGFQDAFLFLKFFRVIPNGLPTEFPDP